MSVSGWRMGMMMAAWLGLGAGLSAAPATEATAGKAPANSLRLELIMDQAEITEGQPWTGKVMAVIAQPPR